MCQRITCHTCGRPSFSGCGKHVESVLRDVPVDERCRCREEPRQAPSSKKAAVGFLDKLFGR